MSADLRALLQEARDMMLSWPTQTQKAARRREELCKNIDAALSEPAPEPISGIGPLYWASIKIDADNHAVTTFLCTNPHDATAIPLYAAPPAHAKDAARYLEALTKIASYREGPIVNSSFDEPESAKIARAAIEREGGANG